ELYSRRLCGLQQGYPLFEPQPFDDLPEPVRRIGTQIGDVGVVTADGAFDPIFNILRQPDDYANRCGVPANFEQVFLSPEESSVLQQIYPPGTVISNNVVNKTNIITPTTNIERFCATGDGAAIEVSTNSNQMAVLILPDGASRSDLCSRNLLRDYALKHAQNWYAFVNGTLQRMLGNTELYLVTGVTKSPSW
ncbi:hypothetical protein C8R43DRAFT_848692, partial [Mycena crocata]